MKTRQDKTREWSKLTFFHNFQSTHALFSAWPFLLIHIQFTPSEGPEDFVNCFSCFFFLSNRTMEVGPSSQTMEKKKPSSMVHGVNRPWIKEVTGLHMCTPSPHTLVRVASHLEAFLWLHGKYPRGSSASLCFPVSVHRRQRNCTASRRLLSRPILAT